MASQTDLDQGGTFREWVRIYMGPSVGWIMAPARNVLDITAAGAYTIIQGCTLVIINTIGAVTLTMPSAINPTVSAGVLPGPYVKNIITIVDIAGTPNVTIDPASGAESIMGLGSIHLGVAYGSFSLRPDNVLKGWTAAQ